MAVIKYRDTDGSIKKMEVGGSIVSVSETGSATETVQYITINGKEYKLAGEGEGGAPEVFIGDDLPETTPDGLKLFIDTNEDYVGEDTYLVAGNYEYSEEEKIIGKWLDGRPIYQKYFTDINIEVSPTAWATLRDLNDIKAKSIINARLIVDGDDGNKLSPFYPYFYLNNSNELKIKDFNGFGVLKGVILSYTKTTDEPNSFKPSMLSAVEIPIKHKYSTVEKVIGEWVDGKPIYEKTIQIGTHCVNYDVASLNIEELVECKANGDNEGDLFIVTYANGLGFGVALFYRKATEKINFEYTNGAKNAIIKYVTIQYTKTTD